MREAAVDAPVTTSPLSTVGLFHSGSPRAEDTTYLGMLFVATCSVGASCTRPGRPGRASPARAPARARPAAAAMAGANPSLNVAAEV
jgi:hypothetical protein